MKQFKEIYMLNTGNYIDRIIPFNDDCVFNKQINVMIEPKIMSTKDIQSN